MFSTCSVTYRGTPLSDAAMRKSIRHIVPKFNRNEEEDSWEALDTKPVAEGAQALRWLVWVRFDRLLASISPSSPTPCYEQFRQNSTSPSSILTYQDCRFVTNWHISVMLPKWHKHSHYMPSRSSRSSLFFWNSEPPKSAIFAEHFHWGLLCLCSLEWIPFPGSGWRTSVLESWSTRFFRGKPMA